MNRPAPDCHMNTVTPRLYIAATRQNDGKTTVSLGLLAALQGAYPRIGYIKPVGQRFVEIEEQKIDEDTVLMDKVYGLNCPLVDMSPIAVEPDFTRKYLQSSNNEALVKKITKAFDRVAWEKDFVLCEGSGHAGVGSVFDLSNAQEFQAFAFQAAARELRDELDFFGEDLVEDHADDFDPFAIKDGLVK